MDEVTDVAVRPATAEDVAAVDALVSTVIAEVHPDIVAEHGAPGGDPQRWMNALVAEADGRVVGVGLAVGDRISDLWVASGWRGRGIGAALLTALEAQVRAAGFPRARLRCVAANARALAFYRRAGWLEERTYPHERNGHPMVDLTRTLARR